MILLSFPVFLLTMLLYFNTSSRSDLVLPTLSIFFVLYRKWCEAQLRLCVQVAFVRVGERSSDSNIGADEFFLVFWQKKSLNLFRLKVTFSWLDFANWVNIIKKVSNINCFRNSKIVKIIYFFNIRS